MPYLVSSFPLPLPACSERPFRMSQGLQSDGRNLPKRGLSPPVLDGGKEEQSLIHWLLPVAPPSRAS